MKRKLLLFALLFAGVTSTNAQLEKTNSPEIGDSQIMYMLDSTQTIPSLTDVVGSDVVWDYSEANGLNGATKTVQIMSPDEAPHGEDYSSSEKALDIEGFFTNFYVEDEDSRVSKGFVFNQPGFGEVQAFFEDNPATQVEFPMDFGDDPITDDFSGDAALEYSGFNLNPDVTGEVHAVIDGRGTLKLSENDYEDVYRYKLVDTMKAIINELGGFVSGEVDVQRTQYEYYHFETGNLPIFIFVEFKIVGEIEGLVNESINTNQTLALSIEEPSENDGEDPENPEDCAKVTGLSVSDVETDGATISWNGEADDEFEYILNTNAATPNEDDEGTWIVETEYQSAGLEDDTEYFFHIRRVCEDENTSEWVTINFSTNKDVSAVNVEEMAGLNIYPNPAETYFTVETAELFESAKIIITDALGKQVATHELNKSKNLIDVASYHKGVYFVTLVSKEKTWTHRLIVR